jgi:class 3 adenylate cyclase
VRAQGGYVAKLLGDGVLAYFGWPQAREDDAERAVRAGLAAAEAVARLETPGPGRWPRGSASPPGPVVVGEVLGEGETRERGVVGKTPNLAARLQGMADPGGRGGRGHAGADGGAVRWADVGEAALKGLPGPVRAWRALGGSGVESRFEALRAGHAAPLVGRGRSWSCCSAAGTGPARARGRWCCCAARPASVSRA